MNSDKFARRFQPQIGHWTHNVVVNQDGSVTAMWHIAGLAAELAGAQAIMSAHLRDNQALRNISDPRIEIWDHYVRQDRQRMASLPPINNWFASRFDEAYRRAQGDGTLYRNDLFVTLVMHPEDSLATGLRALFGAAVSDHPQVHDIALQDFETVLEKFGAGLARYGACRLGTREADGVVFSEIAEALHLIVNGRFRPIGLTLGRLGALVVPDRVVFGHQDIQVMCEGEPLFAGLLSFKDYPARTRPTLFTPLRAVPFPITITNSTRCKQKVDALATISLRIKQMQSGNDAARSQVEELVQDEDDVQSGRSVYVTHQFLVAVHAPDLVELDRRISRCQTVLSEAGITSVRETDALKPAFYAQIPGNMRWRPRPGLTKSINAIGLAARHNVPRGTYKGRWGAPVVMLRTTSDTEYAFHFHVQGAASIPREDMGSCLLIGAPSSGKTSLLGSVCMLALRNPVVRVVIIDKDYGLSTMVRAVGGSYLVLQAGSRSGLAPLLGLQNNEQDVAYLVKFHHGLILSDGRGGISPDEETRLARAVAMQMRMPASERSIGGIAVMLGQRDKNGAGARLRRWCRGEKLGWAFDNETDLIRMDKRVVGFDTTALLKEDDVCSPTLSYIFYQTRKLINGLPIILAIDEFWQSDRVEAFREENNDHLKTIRKNEGVVLLATQSAYDALNSPNAHTLKQAIPTKIFFGDENADRNELCGGMGLTEAEFLAVSQELPSRKHTFLIKRPGGSVLCRFDLSGAADKIAVVSSRRSTYELASRLIRQHGEDPQAWVPHYERLAPGIVDEPSNVQFREAAE